MQKNIIHNLIELATADYDNTLEYLEMLELELEDNRDDELLKTEIEYKKEELRMRTTIISIIKNLEKEQ